MNCNNQFLMTVSRSANTTIQKWVFRRCAQYLQFKLATIHNISEKYFTWYVLMFCPIASWSGNTEPEQTKNECPDVTRRASIKLSTDFFKLQIFWFQMSSKFSEKYSYPLQYLQIFTTFIWNELRIQTPYLTYKVQGPKT